MAEREADTARDSDELEWTVWPARRRPAVSILVAALIVGLSAAAVLVYQSPWYGVMVASGLFIATMSHYLPTRYRIDAQGVSLNTPLSSASKEWAAFAVWSTDDWGVFLSTSSRPTRLQRGIYLPFDDNKDAVTEYVKKHVKRAGTDN
jgi:hypothetical protein